LKIENWLKLAKTQFVRTRVKIDQKAIEFAEVIIHLAGENIAAKPWTNAQKLINQMSRQKTTQLLYQSIQRAKKRPEMLISASAVGYYGAITSEHIFTEVNSPANDFLGTTARQWETEVAKFKELSLKVHILRIGVVISPHGGALPKMLTAINLGLGSALGSGMQYMPWISLADLIRMFDFVMSDKANNMIYNAVAPNHITHADFMKTMATIYHKPFFMPNVPAFILRLIMGEMAAMVLEGSSVSSKRIIEDGFKFKNPTLESIFITE
jgi:uncharacterized protein (TIGR01777 family)